VHQLVLDDHGEDATVLRHGIGRGPLRHRVDGGEHGRAHPVAIGQDVVEVRPALGHLRVIVAARGVVHVGIDAPGEHVVEGGSERRLSQRPRADVNPGEGRQGPMKMNGCRRQSATRKASGRRVEKMRSVRCQVRRSRSAMVSVMRVLPVPDHPRHIEATGRGCADRKSYGPRRT
jgi:hypothetical protein